MFVPLARVELLLAERAEAVSAELAKANCAGQACEDRERCRRYRVRVDAGWHSGTGRWASFDIERLARGGECPSFKRFIERGA